MRPTKTRIIGWIPCCRRFHPEMEAEDVDKAAADKKEVTIRLDMLEAMRLVDAEGLSQEQAAQSMHVSTPTLCRILGKGRQLVALALTNGSIINIEGGNIMRNNTIQEQHGHNHCHRHGGHHGHETMMESGGTCTHEDKGFHQGMGHGRCGSGRRHCAQHMASNEPTESSTHNDCTSMHE
ncbi:MAG: DUF134 domain-containing protein [Selenomonas sp.]|nr:DUF134 domain-containing protein [Selenomonas sp.]